MSELIFILESANEKKNDLRETRVPVSRIVLKWLNVTEGKVFADYTALYNKHKNQFGSPDDVKAHVDHVLSNPTLEMEATKREYTLLVRRNGKDKVAVVDFELKGGKYRVRSAYTLNEGQLEAKIKEIRARGGRLSTNPANPIPPELRSLIQGAGTPSDVLTRSPLVDNLTPISNNVKKITESATGAVASKGGNIMGETIKCTFNLFEEGRQYTGHHRNYILESAIKACYAPETREGIRLREKLGYLGHGRREIARKLQLAEVEPVKLPDGSTIIVENIPSNITTFFEVNKDGIVEHHQEILETAPGKVVSGLNASKVGGFSWACGGQDGGAMGATRIVDFHGFDYVMNPGFAKNRGYILENADGMTKDAILESICKQGVTDTDAERYLNSWVVSAQLRAMELDEKLEQAAIYEDALREDLEGKAATIEAMQKSIADAEAAAEARKQRILEAASKSVVVVPERVIDAMLSMAGEAEFHEVIGFFEAASRVDLGRLPLPGSNDEQKRRFASLPPQYRPAEDYGRASQGFDFADPLTGF